MLQIITILLKEMEQEAQTTSKMLSIVPGIGVDRYIGADIYIYAEVRVWIPTDGFPSRYIYINDRAPWTGMASLGLRVMF